jgi:NADPH:quinone reductase-like Zn-dependent oxidoreductase
MKAIVQNGYGSADVLQLREIDKPALLDDRVLVRVRSAAVNALDWHSVHGGVLVRGAAKLMRQKSIPVRGVDLAGVVEDVGSNVTRLRPGDEVFGGGPGTFAEYVSAREDRLVPKPRNLSFEQAAAVPVAGLTALQGLRDKGALKPGQRVLVYGAGGGVGTFAVQIAKALGAHVTAVTRTRNLEIVRQLGPDELVDYTREDVARRSARYDLVYDVAANRSIDELRRLLAPGGTLVLAGAAKASWVMVFARIAKALALQRIGGQRVVMYISHHDLADLMTLKDLLEAGTICPVIDRQYPLEQTAEAVRYVGSGQARAKVVINVA